MARALKVAQPFRTGRLNQDLIVSVFIVLRPPDQDPTSVLA